MMPRMIVHSLLRRRDGHHARVTNEELFFDLVYAFAVTQLSHHLLHDLSPHGVLEALVLWFAVWLGWQYMAWFTNWFDPERPVVRALVFATMLLALLMSSAIPQAFGERGLVFALAYVAMQVGRSVFAVLALGRGHALYDNYRRILGWLCISAVLWIAGGLAADPGTRIAWWIAAIACEYLSPMIGFALPVLGRSLPSRDWTIEGGHMAERCQLFTIVAIGEALLATGGQFSAAGHWDATLGSALMACLLGTAALWWLYFGTASRDATEAITRAEDPGRVGAWFNYVHAILVAGIIVSAVGNDLVLEHPHRGLEMREVAVLVAGPAIYLLGSAIYKAIVYGRVPTSHVAGALALAVLVPVGRSATLLAMGWLTTLVLLVVCVWNRAALKRRRARA